MNEPLRLFLLESNEEVALVISLHLERAGHRVTTCRAVADALMVLRHTPHHLVLLDDRLADMAGVDVLLALRSDGIRTPVLMMSATGGERPATQAILAGAIDYLVKDDALVFLTHLPQRVKEAVARSRLQESNQLLSAALDAARDGICTADLQGAIRHVNPALERLSGYSRAELLGQPPRILHGVNGQQSAYDEMWQALGGGRSWQGEVVVHRKDGTLLDASLTFSPISDGSGQLTHFVGIYRDQTERKQLQRQLLHAQKMQSVGTLAGGVAHEFNNVLAGIQGYAALALRESELPAQARQFMEQIVDLSTRAATLTRQLLAFARKPTLSRRPIDMVTFLVSSAEFMRQSLSIDVQVEIAAGEPLEALADANQLQQVLVNLVLNARDALERPEPILIRLEQTVLAGELPAYPENVPCGDYLVIEIRDRGRGMTAEVLEHAFDPFFTTKDIGKGSGLGLPVASGIVHGHQGRLALESQPGVGTTVRVYLPRLEEGPRAVSESSSDSGRFQLTPTQARAILVVDDETSVLDVVQRFLQIAGHRVRCVTSGAEALEALGGGEAFDIVILDWMIPFEDGAETLQTLRRRWPNLPVLLCTGILQADGAPQSIDGERVRILRKPFPMQELWQAVERVAGQRK